jgi:hypothetical protein
LPRKAGKNNHKHIPFPETVKEKHINQDITNSKVDNLPDDAASQI